MTLPDERYRAVTMAKKFLEDIAYNSAVNTRIPKSIRARAHSILRHYPSDLDLKITAKAVPSVFQEKIEPVYRLILEHENNKNSDITP